MNTKMSNKLLPILFIAVTGKIFFGSYAITSSYRNSLTDSSIVESSRISHSVGGPTGVKNTYISRDCNAEALSVFQSVLPGLSPCLLYTSPSPRDATLSRMPSSA